jgi:drug/metabolite transporter (DMT)-like permease
VVPPRRVLARLVLVGLAVQLLGNLSVQWAYGVVGLAITISTIFGVMLTASALMGYLFLQERVSVRSMAAIILLFAAIVLLCLDADDVNRAISIVKGTVAGSGQARLGVGAACLGGATYAVLSVVLRHTAGAGIPVTSIVFIVTGMGVLSMGSLSLGRLGWSQLAATPPEQLAWMLAAGGFNLIAFLAITKGLQLTTVVRASLLNASQVALGAIAGLVLFAEPMTRWLIFGVALTIAGMMLIDLPDEEETEAPGA